MTVVSVCVTYNFHGNLVLSTAVPKRSTFCRVQFFVLLGFFKLNLAATSLVFRRVGLKRRTKISDQLHKLKKKAMVTLSM